MAGGIARPWMRGQTVGKGEPDREEILDTLEMGYAFLFRFTAAGLFHVLA